MKKYRVVHVISSLKMGGAEILLIDLIKYLRKQEYDQSVVFFYDGPIKNRIEALNIPVYHVKGLISLYDPVFWVRLYLLLRRAKPDLIHSSLWAANCAARLIGLFLRVPVLCAVHLGVNLDGRIRNSIDRYTFCCAKKVIAISDHVYTTIQKKKWIHPVSMALIRNGIDYVGVQKRAQIERKTHAALGLSDDHFIIGSVGRFSTRKNHAYLLRVFAQVHIYHPNARLFLIGFGPGESSLRALAKLLGIDAVVYFMVNESAYGYYPLMNCFVLPSLQEGLSIALLEAMACSIMPIITYESVRHEVVKHGYNGFVIPTLNQQLLVKLFDSLIRNKHVCEKYGERAFETIKSDFTIERMATEYIQEYEHIFNAK